MARKAGVTASETKAQLIAAAAEVFAAKGYEGARVSDIAEEAGLSTGAVYAHYSGKTDLLLHAIAARSADAVDHTVGGAGDSVLDTLERSGSHLRTRRSDPLLLLEGVTAGRREPELAAILREQVSASRAQLADRVRAEQRDGKVHRAARPDAVAHLSILLGLGSLVANALDLEPPTDDDWDTMIAGMVDEIRFPPTPDTTAADPAA